MIGPTTRKFAEIYETVILPQQTKGLQDLFESGTASFTVIFTPAGKLAMVAHALVKQDSTVSPKMLFGDWWFMYYQAWLWKLSKKWREHIIECWLNDIDPSDCGFTLLRD